MVDGNVVARTGRFMLTLASKQTADLNEAYLYVHRAMCELLARSRIEAGEVPIGARETVGCVSSASSEKRMAPEPTGAESFH